MPGIPSVCESSQVARDLLLAEAAQARYHVCHVSAKETVRVIRDAKKAGIKVTCEVTPHHLLLSDEDIKNDDANFKMNPPLRDITDQKALLEGILDGTIDCIASDHAPHTIEDKSSGLLTAPFGIIGLEYGFALLYTHFVKTGIFSLESLVNWMSIKPAECFGLKGSQLQIGSQADLAFFDLQTEVTIPEIFKSLSSNSPFIGRKVVGDAVMTMVDGKIVWRK
jgi:dihydroorotase